MTSLAGSLVPTLCIEHYLECLLDANWSHSQQLNPLHPVFNLICIAGLLLQVAGSCGIPAAR